MKKKTAVRMLPVAFLVAYFGIYFCIRSYCWIYAPHAWGRGASGPNTGSSQASDFFYMRFSRLPSRKLRDFEFKVIQPLVYHFYSPLVELDLSINNHPLNPLSEWKIYGNNWP